MYASVLLIINKLIYRTSHLKIVEEKGDGDDVSRPKCYVIDNTTLEKTGSRFEKLSRVFDHVTGTYVKGYKLNLLAFFDGKATLPVDFSLHREKGKKRGCGLTSKELTAGSITPPS